MGNDRLKTLYDDYLSKIDQIIDKYGEKEGFIINGKYWWDDYKERIDLLLSKSKNNTLTENEASDFYKSFGFAPKLYGRSFIENGIDKLQKVFLFLADESIPPEKKIQDIVEEPESENFIKGVGINFITLFLTVLFPDKYVQWNMQTDGALKLLKLYPERERGERKSAFYSKINKVCTEISHQLGIILPHVDNLLYCLNKGYIGFESGLPQEPVTTIEEVDVEDSVTPPSTAEKSTHLEMTYYLVKIGLNKGYEVWVASNDKNKVYNNEKLSDLCLKEIPNFTQPSTLGIAKYIDVIWFKRNTSYPVRFFEIEHTTSIFSGLLRLNDVKIDYPLSKASIVIPKKRLDLFETQLERRTFKYSELSDVCDSLTYENVKQWFNAVDIDAKYK